MKKKTPKKNYAFVDNANVTVSVARQGRHIDRGKLKGRLERRWNVEKVFMLMGYHPDYEPMYDYFKSLGYELVFKPMNIGENIELKGNIDTDLVLRVMKERTKYDKAILLTGDGDFLSLVKHLKEKKKLGQIIVPHSGRYSHFLDEAAGEFITSLTGKKRWLAYIKGSKNKHKGKVRPAANDAIKNQKSETKKVHTTQSQDITKTKKVVNGTEEKKPLPKNERPVKSISREQKKPISQKPQRRKQTTPVQKQDQIQKATKPQTVRNTQDATKRKQAVISLPQKAQKTVRPQTVMNTQDTTKRKQAATSRPQNIQQTTRSESVRSTQDTTKKKQTTTNRPENTQKLQRPKDLKRPLTDTKMQDKKPSPVKFPQPKTTPRTQPKKVVTRSKPSSHSGISFPKGPTSTPKKSFSKPTIKQPLPKKQITPSPTKKAKVDPSHHTRFFD